MTKTKPIRRDLSFDNFDEMMAEVRSLHSNGYTSRGNWTLAQACGHLSDWMRFPMDGFPVPPLPMRMIFWAMKVTVGPGMKKKILAGGFKPGMPTAPDTVPKPDAMSDQEAIETLQGTIDRLQEFDDELLPSPLFGPMDKETLEKVSLLHAAHHLGFLE